MPEVATYTCTGRATCSSIRPWSLVRTVMTLTTITGIATAVSFDDEPAALSYGEAIGVSEAQAGAAGQQTDQDKVAFQQLVTQWKEATVLDSSVRDMVAHPAYLRIVGMGWRAVPLLLREMALAPDHWGPALTAITGQNPVQKPEAGKVKAIARAWVAWGHARGFDV
jgi:hypothetical protein